MNRKGGTWRLVTLAVSSMLALGLVGSTAHAASPHTFIVSSEAGDSWTRGPFTVGLSQMTFGHDGCLGLDPSGYCLSGSWPKVNRAHWIWAEQMVTQEEAVYGTSATFLKEFEIPETAIDLTGVIRITADDEYVVMVNGHTIGTDGTVGSVDSYSFDTAIERGLNRIKVLVKSRPQLNGTPATNPAGLAYLVTVSYVA